VRVAFEGLRGEDLHFVPEDQEDFVRALSVYLPEGMSISPSTRTCVWWSVCLNLMMFTSQTIPIAGRRAWPGCSSTIALTLSAARRGPARW
jgi:hypothetical protein